MKSFKLIIYVFITFIALIGCSKNASDSNGNCETCIYTVTAGESVATVPNEILGQFDLILEYSQGGYAFANGTKGKFTISEKEMIIEIEGQDCITLKNPVASANQVEFTFTDNCRDNLKYSASISSNGGLNEINVGTISGTFYGQFH